MSNYTSLEDEQFFGAIGRLSITWAHLEFGIDAMIFLLHHTVGGHEIEQEIPWSLSRKLRYIKRCVKKLEGFAPVADSVVKLMDEIKAASETRNDIIHGFIVQHEPESGQATMMRLLRGATYSRKSYTVTTLTILLAAKEANRLCAIVTKITTGMMAALKTILHKPEDADGKV